MAERDCFLEEKENTSHIVVSMYEKLEKFLNSDKYTEDLRNELQQSNPDYPTVLEKRRLDMGKTDHGIVVSGETCAGKSTLLNKILEMGIFAGKNLESTDTICKIRNSEIIRIITENNKKETKEIDLTHTCDLKTKEGVKTLREHIAKLTDKTISKECLELQSVDVGFPIPFLKKNVIFVDTPGIGGTGEIPPKLKEYIPNAVSFIFVIDVSRAGGMQKDRLPKILTSIAFLQLQSEMPCFDPEDVIFITNKWDNIKIDEDVGDLEEEISNTWESIISEINTCWPVVKQEHIFRMNLLDVSRGSDQENPSKVEFKNFRRLLDLTIKKAENIRLIRHLRLLQDILENISKGLNARLQSGHQSETDIILLADEHQEKINELNEKCKMKRSIFRETTFRTLNEITQECYHYMSTEFGKNIILNPPGRIPILDVSVLSLPGEIKARLTEYVESYLASAPVREKLTHIKKDIENFYNDVSEDIRNMETEWTNVRKRNENNWGEALLLPIQISLLAFGFVLSVSCLILLSPVLIPLSIYLTTNDGKKKYIDLQYPIWSDITKEEINRHLLSNCGSYITGLVDKVTNEWLPRRINALELTIRNLRKSHEEIIANRETFTNLMSQINDMENSVADLLEKQFYGKI